MGLDAKSWVPGPYSEDKKSQRGPGARRFYFVLSCCPMLQIVLNCVGDWRKWEDLAILKSATQDGCRNQRECMSIEACIEPKSPYSEDLEAANGPPGLRYVPMEVRPIDLLNRKG